MVQYALLARESANRVFGQWAPKLLRAEVLALGPHLSKGVSDVRIEQIGGLSFATFEAESLTPTDRFILSNFALGRGLFERTRNGALSPIDPTPLSWFESDLITIQRYTGKTNEQFTHLLVNLAIAASPAAHARAFEGRQVRLLDPVSGRGSTLNRGLMYGFDVAGIELDETSVEQNRIFLTTYLKDHRIKHKAERERIRKGDLAGSSAFEIAIRPESPTERQHVRVCLAETSLGSKLFPGKRFDVIVGDLPYGIQHSSKKGSRKGRDADRSPEQLVSDSLSGWTKLLEHGGGLALSWNIKTLTRDCLVGMLTEVGLEVVIHPESFEHEVDRQITRDLIVATL